MPTFMQAVYFTYLLKTWDILQMCEQWLPCLFLGSSGLETKLDWVLMSNHMTLLEIIGLRLNFDAELERTHD